MKIMIETELTAKEERPIDQAIKALKSDFESVEDAYDAAFPVGELLENHGDTLEKIIYIDQQISGCYGHMKWYDEDDETTVNGTEIVSFAFGCFSEFNEHAKAYEQIAVYLKR